jgi:hypothetical protein
MVNICPFDSFNNCLGQFMPPNPPHPTPRTYMLAFLVILTFGKDYVCNSLPNVHVATTKTSFGAATCSIDVAQLVRCVGHADIPGMNAASSSFPSSPLICRRSSHT